MQRSTEQLTCSAGNLEEIQDNTDGILTRRTVSEKIMSICKNTIRWVIVLDVFLALTVIVLLTVLEFGTVPQQHIGFYCNDPKISFKFMGDTISMPLLIVGSVLMPILVMWITEFVCYSASNYEISLGCAGSRTKQIWLWYGHYAVGLTALTFICDVVKTLVGEPRPHFLDTCRPREAENCTDEYVATYTCTNKEYSAWFISDSSKSFPSGHSALSMFTTVFIVWYLQKRLPDWTFFLKPWLQCTICLWTVVCSVTRIGDNRHHWWDVLAGLIMGLFFSVLTITVNCRKFKLDRKIPEDYRTDPVENSEQTNLNNKRQHNVKKLLETTVDVSETRELRNVRPSTTWKE